MIGVIMQAPLAADHYEQFRLHEAAEAAMAVVAAGNLFVDGQAPWTAFKKVHFQLPCIH
jgi:methionyl-tRNA synthetase